MTLQIVKEEVRKWDKPLQADLMHYLVELMTKEKIKISEEERIELRKRLESLENGTSVGRPAEEVFAKYANKK